MNQFRARCVEAAVCFALGLPHGDQPPCVHPALINFKIGLNDLTLWSSDKARGKGMRRLAVAQLGSKEKFNGKVFADELLRVSLIETLPRIAKSLKVKGDDKAAIDALPKTVGPKTREKLLAARDKAYEGSYNEVYNAIQYLADAAPRTKSVQTRTDYIINAITALIDEMPSKALQNKHLSLFAEDAVQVLIKMKVPGRKFLALTE